MKWEYHKPRGVKSGIHKWTRGSFASGAVVTSYPDGRVFIRVQAVPIYGVQADGRTRPAPAGMTVEQARAVAEGMLA